MRPFSPRPLSPRPAGSGGSLAEARLRLAYGSWLRRHRRMREARIALTEAHDTFTSLGAEGFAYRATRELHAAGAERPTPRRDGLPWLTSQELQIAQLAAHGLSSRQIGERLFPVPPHGGLAPVPPVPEARHHHAGPARRRAQGRGAGQPRFPCRSAGRRPS
jgi:hypothetical protein